MYKQISYRASPSWACDTSQAEAGTDAVAFLDKAQMNGLEIASEGRGRYPLFNEDSTNYIDVRDTRLPPELASKIKPAVLRENSVPIDSIETKQVVSWLNPNSEVEIPK
jgi:hypothetical protein